MPTVYITAPEKVAPDLAETLVEERLAACVNRTEITSVFRWDDDIERDDSEVLLLAKTTDERYDDLVERVEQLHPYEVPCIERFEESDILPAFERWRDGAVSAE